MTLHGAEKAPPSDLARQLEDIARAARAASHCRRLDTAVAAALAGQQEMNAATVDAIRSLTLRLETLEGHVPTMRGRRP